LLAEALEDSGDGTPLVGIRGHCLDGRAGDVGLELLGSALGDDPPMVDDPHAVG
jgi:hypothetical protein